MDFYFDDDDAMPRDTTIAWSINGRWSKIHETNDRGTTTLCGQTVPEAETTDSWSQMGSCKRCLALKRAFPKQ